MTSLLNGLLGGLLIGLVAGIALQLIDNDPSATAVILSQVVDEGTATSRGLGFAGQVAYGGLAGLGLLALELYALGVLSVPPAFGTAFGVALVWSALLSVVWFVIWRALPSFRWDRSYVTELLMYHLVFGLGFGLWIRVTWIT